MLNRNTQTQDLLEHEIDGGVYLSELVLEILGVRDRGQEVASFTSTGELVAGANGRMTAYPSR